MTNEEMNVLREARKAVCELQSLDEILKAVNSRLFGIPVARIDNEQRGAVDPYAKEQLMDQKNNIENKLLNARLSASVTLMQAEEIIERVKRPKVRAALRYYYMCGKTCSRVSALLGCNIRTVQRWVYNKI